MINMKYHDELREIFIKNQITPLDGRSIEELSDDEIEEMFNEIIHLMSRMALKLGIYINQVAVVAADFNKAWEESIMGKK